MVTSGFDSESGGPLGKLMTHCKATSFKLSDARAALSRYADSEVKDYLPTFTKLSAKVRRASDALDAEDRREHKRDALPEESPDKRFPLPKPVDVTESARAYSYYLST